MITIGSVKEDLTNEKRISITPEIVKKFTNQGLSINLEKSYAEHLGISDGEFKTNGANINITKEEVFKKSDVILKVNEPISDEFNLIKEKSLLIGQFDPNFDKNIIDKLVKKM